jgi:hypothetical protein
MEINHRLDKIFVLKIFDLTENFKTEASPRTSTYHNEYSHHRGNVIAMPV